VNVSPRIGAVLSASTDKAATLVALSTTLGLEDLYNLIEVIEIDRHNDTVISKHAAKDRQS
jgi:hypothetical protein